MTDNIKNYTDTLLDWILIFVSLFFTFNFERLYNISQNFFTLNYDYFVSPNSDWSFLKYYADKNLLFTNYTLIYIFLIFISLFTYIYMIKNIKIKENLFKTPFLIYSCFLWFFIMFLIFTSSMEKYNFVLIPGKNINVTYAKELLLIGSRLFFSYTYLKSFLDMGSQLIFVTVITYMAFIIFNCKHKLNVDKLTWALFTMNLLFFLCMSCNNYIIGNLTVTGTSFIIGPGLVNPHIAYPIPSSLLYTEKYLILFFIVLFLLMVFEKEITEFRMDSFLKKVRRIK